MASEYDLLADLTGLVRAGFNYDTIDANVYAERIAENLSLTDEDDGSGDYRPSILDAAAVRAGLAAALGHPARSVTFDLTDVDARHALTTALEDYAVSERDMAAHEGGNESRERWAERADKMRRQAEEA